MWRNKNRYLKANADFDEPTGFRNKHGIISRKRLKIKRR
jgi:hypothetical protein